MVSVKFHVVQVSVVFDIHVDQSEYKNHGSSNVVPCVLASAYPRALIL